MRVLPATLGHEAQGSSCSFRRQLLPGQTQWGGPTISCSSLSQEQWSALGSSPDLSPLRKGGCARAEGSWGKERCQVFELGSAPVRARPPFVENSGPYEWLWARVGARGRVRSRISPTPYASPLDAEGTGRGKGEEGLAATWGSPAAIPIGPGSRRTGRYVCVHWLPLGRRSK